MPSLPRLLTSIEPRGAGLAAGPPLGVRNDIRSLSRNVVLLYKIHQNIRMRLMSHQRAVRDVPGHIVDGYRRKSRTRKSLR